MTLRHERSVAQARETLGVGPNAGADEIRRAFRSVSKSAHPDHGGTAERFAEVHDAYDLLREEGADPVGEWFVDGIGDPPDVRVVYDSPPRRVRRSFQQVFAEALRSRGRTS